MESNQSIRLGAERSAIQVSGKFRNDNDGLIWSTPNTKGRPDFHILWTALGFSPEEGKNWSNDST